MFRKYAWSTLMLSLFAASTACNRDLTATQMQHAKMDETMAAPRAHLVYMADNALLHDMSVADLHFVPHTHELSGTGIARLDRMAVLLDTYGGTVRYETFSTDARFVQARLDHVREYIATTGCDMGRVEVKAMLSGGRGMSAEKAIAAEEKAAAPQGAGGAPAAGAGVPFLP
jgi:hypothetical protein